MPLNNEEQKRLLDMMEAGFINLSHAYRSQISTVYSPQVQKVNAAFNFVSQQLKGDLGKDYLVLECEITRSVGQPHQDIFDSFLRAISQSTEPSLDTNKSSIEEALGPDVSDTWKIHEIHDSLKKIKGKKGIILPQRGFDQVYEQGKEYLRGKNAVSAEQAFGGFISGSQGFQEGLSELGMPTHYILFTPYDLRKYVKLEDVRIVLGSYYMAFD